MPLIHPHKTKFFCLFFYYMMYIFNTMSAIKMTINENFIFKNDYRRVRFTIENHHSSMKHQKKKDLLLLATKQKNT